MGNLVGSNLWSPAVHQGAGGAIPFEVIAYFYASERDKKVYKIKPDGTITIFKSYATLEPNGCAVDSANGRLFVMMGDTAEQFQVDRFDDLSIDTGATAAASISSHTAHGGAGRYVYHSDELIWGSELGTPDGIHKVNGALTTFTTIDTADGTDCEYWPPDDEVYSHDGVANRFRSGNLDATSWAIRGGATSGFESSMVVPPAYLMGGNKYLMIGEATSGRIDRYTSRTAPGSRLTWLDTTAAGTAIKLFIRCLRFDYANNRLTFVGHDNGGTGVFGLYSIPLQEGAQSEGNLTLIADIGAAGSTARNLIDDNQGLGIHYNSDPSGLMVDVLP